MRHVIIGPTIQEAQGYYMRCKEEYRGKEVRIMSPESVRLGGLRGYGKNTEIVVLERAWGHKSCVALGLELEYLELTGARVVTAQTGDAA